jgi:predicted dehydrogenase
MTDRTSRRQFLEQAARTTAAAGVLSALSPAEELLADPRPVPRAQPVRPPAPAEPVRMAVIGTGGMGTGHCESILGLAKKGLTDVRIEALCDICEPRLLAAKKKVDEAQGGSVATFGDYRALLAADLHGVLIATPEHWHAKIAEDAIKAGKDVYLEKPMTLRLKDALRLRDVVMANPSVMFNVGTQYVMTPSYTAAKELIANGTIGKPVWSQTSYCRNSKDGEWLYYDIDPAWQPGVNLNWKAWCGSLGQIPWNPEIYARWRRYRKYSTGIIGDLLVHRITPLIMAMNLGWPTRVVASGGHYIDKAMENHDQVNLQIEFEDEHTMIVAGSTCNELGLETVIRGRKGNLFVGGRNLVLRPEQLFAEEVEEKTIPGPADWGDDQDQLRLHWLESIRTRVAPRSNVDLGTKVMAIVDLAARSMWEGRAFAYQHAKKKVKRL